MYRETLLKKFQRYLHEEERSPHTISAYAGDVRGFLVCVEVPLESLSKADILTYKDRLTAEYEVSTRNRKLAALSVFLRFARSDGAAIPPVSFKFFESYDNHVNCYLTENEARRCIAAAEAQEDWRAAAVFAGLFYSGARVSELLQVKKSEASQKIIWIVGKGKKERKLYLSNEELRRTWQKYLASKHGASKHGDSKHGDDCPFFFSGRRGQITRQTVSEMVKAYAGLVRPRLKREKAHAHAFRHGCAMWLKSRGKRIDQVADILGHRSLETTRIYFRDTEAELLEMMQ